MFKRKKVGVALSGGGMKGVAHIGVLRVLEEYNIPIDLISGTSAVAIIGALYSAEPNAKKLEKEILSQDLNDLIDYTISSHGFVKGKKIEDFLSKRLHNIQFKDLKIPLFITACDLQNNQEIIFSKGSVVKAIRASISVPGIFIPVENHHRILVDGGVMDPVPTEILRKMGAEIIIAVNVNSIKTKKTKSNEKATIESPDRQLPSALNAATRAIEIMGAEVAKTDITVDKADLVINIDLEGISLLDSKRTKYAIEKGKRATKNNLNKIKALTQSSPLKELFSNLQTIDKAIGVEKIVSDVKKEFKNKRK